MTSLMLFILQWFSQHVSSESIEGSSYSRTTVRRWSKAALGSVVMMDCCVGLWKLTNLRIWWVGSFDDGWIQFKILRESSFSCTRDVSLLYYPEGVTLWFSTRVRGQLLLLLLLKFSGSTATAATVMILIAIESRASLVRLKKTETFQKQSTSLSQGLDCK